MATHQQLPLRLDERQRLDFDTFVPGENAAAIAQLQRFAREKTDDWPVLHGPKGCGKTHLLVATCHAAGHRIQYIDLGDAHALDLLTAVSDQQSVLLDNFESVCGDLKAEEAVFHMFNRIRQGGGQLGLAVQSGALDGIQLPDLKSRLQWGVMVPVKALAEQDADLQHSLLGGQLRSAI